MSKPRKPRFSALAIPKPAGTADEAIPLKSGARRSSGKRKDPEYSQLTAYVRKELHQAVRVALINDGNGQEISELVEELIEKWLAKRKQN